MPAGCQALPAAIHNAAALSERIYYKVQQPQSCIQLLNSTAAVGCNAASTEAALEIFSSSFDDLTGTYQPVLLTLHMYAYASELFQAQRGHGTSLSFLPRAAPFLLLYYIQKREDKSYSGTRKTTTAWT